MATERSGTPGESRSRIGPARWFFDAWSHVYDLGWVQRLTYRPVHDVVAATIGERGPRDLLDVGCGTGLLAARLRGLLPRARIVGCDFSAGMLQQAARRDRRCLWVQGDAQRLPFGNGSFDAIVCTEAFHWFPDQATAAREFFRVLVPGGVALIALVNPSFELLSDAVHRGARLLGEPFYWPTQAGMRRQVEAAGLRVAAQHRISRIPGALLFPGVLTVAHRPG